MKILLYNPDNGVTRNFMPRLWMFLLKALTPPEHEVLLIDGNAQALDEEGLARFVREQEIGLVGIGAMTRMVAKAYRMADAARAAGVPVVMGGPHVTEAPDEALGRDGGPRHADAVALGEADETWPQIVADAAQGRLKETYAPVDAAGKEHKPSLQPYPSIPWESMDLDQFNIIPNFLAPILERVGGGWKSFRIIPVESGRGCPYGCEFCTVTGFFGDSIRFRTNESVAADARSTSPVARRPARFRTIDALPIDAFIRPPKGGRPVNTSEALDGFCPLSNGAHATEDDRRAGAGRSQTSLDGFVQPGGDLARG